MKSLYINLFFILFSIKIYSQTNIVNEIPVEYDKCGFPINNFDEPQYISPEYMGYSYDSLLADLELWKMSRYVKIDSIGLSVQGRPLWQLTISNDPNNVFGKRTVHIHARTHPQETEGFYVTDEIIKILLSESNFAQTVRANCVFYIIPMYNPDGVVLGHPRTNANNVDLESNWNTFPHQPEVATLKAQFTQLMSSPNPIEVMLNMHSSSLCTRYFVYHHETGTSPSYAVLEQDFINGVRNYYPGGIEPYNYFVSWTSGTALQYPESWFWLNHGENVMALTYEDMYQCSGTGNFDSTANAILRGVMDYMEIVTDVEQIANVIPTGFELYQNFPNPFNPATIIKYAVVVNSIHGGGASTTPVRLMVYDILGNEISTLVNEEQSARSYEVEFNPASSIKNATSGVYFYRLQTENYTETKKMIYLK
jgi:hypothetical protein